MKTILSYEEVYTTGPAIAGGKGWNLARLHRYGFSVPEGFVISADLYSAMINEPRLGEPVRKISISDSPPSDLIRKKIHSFEFPPGFAEELMLSLAEKGLADAALAVRSSATAEDSEEASFAGIHSSYLNVRGIEEILSAIKNCYASLWTERAIAYRESRNIPHGELHCAVLVCRMVSGLHGEEPEFAGVAFSCDPLTGRKDQVRINSTPGLGERLVSGSINPEEIILTKGKEPVLKTGDSGRFLPAEEIFRLERLVKRITQALGGEARDIEWAYDGHGFVFLQARPVTGLPHRTYEELRDLPIIWANGNFKEVLPELLSPMGRSYMNRRFADVYYPFRAIGFRMPEGVESKREFSGRFYFDMTLMQFALYKAVGISPAFTNRTVGGHQPEIRVKKSTLAEQLGHYNNYRRMFFLLRRTAATMHQDIAAMQRRVQERLALDLKALDYAALAELNREWRRYSYEFSGKFQLCNHYAGLFQPALNALLAKTAPARSAQIASGLMAGSDAVISAEQGYELYSLAQIARNDSEALLYLNGQSGSLPPDNPFARALQGYLEKFGHRGVSEEEIANPRWVEEPGYLLEQVRAILAGGDHSDPRLKARKVRESAEKEVDALPLLYRLPVRYLAGLCRKASALRELAKSGHISSFLVQRTLLLEIGRRLVKSNKLRSPDDIFFLVEEDIDCLLHGDWDGRCAQALVDERRERHEEWKALRLPDVIITDRNYRPVEAGGDAFIIPETGREEDSSGTSFLGVAVAPGRISGRVRIIERPGEGGKLLNGEILVAPGSDPGWTPLFLRASALVMETGGYLSHASIVAREYGIPAVVNIPGITEILKDGDEVTVDGDTGRIIIEKAATGNGTKKAGAESAPALRNDKVS